jgi:hypothetical protein
MNLTEGHEEKERKHRIAVGLRNRIHDILAKCTDPYLCAPCRAEFNEVSDALLHLPVTIVDISKPRRGEGDDVPKLRPAER